MESVWGTRRKSCSLSCFAVYQTLFKIQISRLEVSHVVNKSTSGGHGSGSNGNTFLKNCEVQFLTPSVALNGIGRLIRLLDEIVAILDITNTRWEVSRVQIHGILASGLILDTHADSERSREVDEKNVVKLVIVEIGDDNIRNGRCDDFVVVLLAPFLRVQLGISIANFMSYSLIIDCNVEHSSNNGSVSCRSVLPLRDDENHLLVLLNFLVDKFFVQGGHADSNLIVVLAKRSHLRLIVDSHSTIDSSLLSQRHNDRGPADLRLGLSDRILRSNK